MVPPSSHEDEIRSIALIGGLGRLGSLIANQALESGYFHGGVLAIARDYDQDSEDFGADKQAAKKLVLEKGGKVIHADVFQEDRAKTVELLKGYDAVIDFSYTYDDETLLKTQNLIDDCIAAGVKRYVPNIFGVDYQVNELPWLTRRKDVHDYMEESSKISYTEFIVGFFADLGNIGDPSILGVDWDTQTSLFSGGRLGNVPISFTYREDVAKFVVAALKNFNASKNKVLRVEGDRARLNDLIKAYESVSGLTFKVQTIDPAYVEDWPLMIFQDKSGRIYEGPEISVFARMALRGTAIVNPGGESVDNKLFPEVQTRRIFDHACEAWTAYKSKNRLE